MRAFASLLTVFPLAATPAAAAIVDPAGDYTAIANAAARQGDLDVLAAEVTLSVAGFTLTSTQFGTIGTTPGGIYVWGVNRGAGTAGFGALAPGVLFDAVVVLEPAGDSFVFDAISGIITPIAPAVFGAQSITGFAPIAALPSLGFDFADYQFNLWPRIAGGGLDNIADFAPDNSSFGPTVLVPAPGMLALLGMGAVALAQRRRI